MNEGLRQSQDNIGFTRLTIKKEKGREVHLFLLAMPLRDL